MGWLKQGIINCKGTETFDKIIAGVRADAHVVQQKKVTGYCSMSVMANLLRFGCFSTG